MLTYVYKCKACGHVFEHKQSIADEPLAECPDCRGPVHRIISGGSGFILKQGSTGRSRANQSACSLQTTGSTCCGLDSPCGASSCSFDN
ncbi:MAG: zinc ribbon domain-containing protein [bacterium]